MPVVRGQALEFQGIPERLVADPLAGLGDAAPGSSVRVVRVQPGPRTPHVHPDSEEIYYVLSGQATAWEDDESSEIGPGDLVVLPAGVPHATVVTSPEGLFVVAFFPHPDLAANTRELDGPERF